MKCVTDPTTMFGSAPWTTTMMTGRSREGDSC